MTLGAHELFRRTVDAPDERIDLTRAALAIAAEEYPNLDIEYYSGTIDPVAAAVSKACGGAGAIEIIGALNDVLFRDLGFRGDEDRYVDPKNSFLNEVIDRRRGIPITLSVLYIEVARRVGLSLQGVGFPGHFLVQFPETDGEMLIDPFNGGLLRSSASLQQWLHEAHGGKIAFRPEFLAPVTRRQIVQRMLNNLKMIYLRDGELLKGLSVAERLVILDPASASDLRERGLLYAKLECSRQALEDLEGYLDRAPGAEDAEAVKAEIESLKKQVMRIQ